MKKIKVQQKAFQKNRGEKIKRNKVARIKRNAYLRHLGEIHRIWVMKQRAVQSMQHSAGGLI